MNAALVTFIANGHRTHWSVNYQMDLLLTTSSDLSRNIGEKHMICVLFRAKSRCHALLGLISGKICHVVTAKLNDDSLF